jgi:hypothetical protein
MSAAATLRLYWCGDCEQWSSLACHDSEHHLRSLESMEYVPVSPQCDAVRESTLSCTRTAGHDGPHVHHDGNGTAVWRRDDG